MIRFIQKLAHSTRVSPGNAEWELTTFSDHVSKSEPGRCWRFLTEPKWHEQNPQVHCILIPFLLVLGKKLRMILSRLPLIHTDTDADRHRAPWSQKERRREASVATLQNCSGQRVWRCGLWPHKESQSQGQPQRAARAHTHRACAFYPRGPCPTRAPGEEGKDSYYEEVGSWQLRVFGPTALGGGVWVLGPVVKDSQCHRNRAVRTDLKLVLKQVTTVFACHSVPNRVSCC